MSATDLTGRKAIVTGANGGLGLETARGLARYGATVVLACRNPERGALALESIRRDVPDGDVRLDRLDLADLSSVHAFASRHDSPLALLINNAGVMALPRTLTADGFETQFGTNHLGHFALTGLLLPALLAGPAARVVTVTSVYHWAGRIRFEDLDGDRRYRRWAAYGQSKLANVLFAKELDRRAAGRLTSVTAHPGYAATDLPLVAPRIERRRLREALFTQVNRFAGRPSSVGARPALHAATAADVRGGCCYAPGRLIQTLGAPRMVRTAARADDVGLARRLWTVSEERTGVSYAALGLPDPRT